MSEASAGRAGAARSEFTPAYRTYALLLLLAVYTSNYVDRQILGLLLEPIKLDLGLSDMALGILSGTAFAIFYATLGVPIAMWADRASRKWIITASLFIWSFMTVLCGLALTFFQLTLARIGVAVGEAGGSPPSHSIISDLYPPESRATALAIFSLGVPIGLLIAFYAGGQIVANEDAIGAWIYAATGEAICAGRYVAGPDGVQVCDYQGWRVAFVLVGLPGILLAAIVAFTLREPARGHSEGLLVGADAPSLWRTWSFMASQKSLVHMLAGATLTTFVGYSFVTWTPAFLIRSHGLTITEVGTYLALVIGFAGGFGTFIGGYAADRLARRDVRWMSWVVAIAILTGIPFFLVSFLAGSTTVALLFMIVPSMIGALYLGPTFAMTQGLVGVRMRAVAAALLLFIINLIGMGGGPVFVGAISDALRETMGAESLRWSLVVLGSLNIWAAFHYWKAAQYLKADFERAKTA